MRSMTGFGRCIMEGELLTQQWEIRSVNSKRLALKWNLPSAVSNLENRFEKVVRRYGTRGRLDISLSLQFLTTDLEHHLDLVRAGSMLQALEQLAKSRNETYVPDYNALLNVPELWVSSMEDMDEELVLTLEQGLSLALEDWNESRETEGEALGHDLLARVLRLEQWTDILRERAPAIKEERAENLRERITEESLKMPVKEEKIPMAKQIKVCMGNKYWWIIILYFLLFQLGGLVKNGSMNYYCTWVFEGIDGGTAMGLLGAIGGIPTAIGMVLAWPIANKLGKQRAVVLGLAISVIGGLASFIDVHNFVIVCVGVILKGIGSIPAMYVTLALLSDVLDHLEAKNGFRSDGFTMSVYGAIMVGMTGLGNGIINVLLTIAGYDASLPAQNASVQNMLVICYLGVELVCYAVIVVLMSFLKVEKHIKEDQAIILENQKAAVLAAGGEWIEPAERLRREQEQAEKEAEAARIEELKAKCAKKGLNFAEEEAKYQAKLAAKRAKQKK